LGSGDFLPGSSLTSRPAPGAADGGDLASHRDPRGHGAPHRQDLLQHLPGQPQPHQPDHGQGHAHADAQRHLHAHGEPGGQCCSPRGAGFTLLSGVAAGQGTPGKVLEFVNGYFQTWKSPLKKSQSFGKVMEMFYIHMEIYAEF